jgi:preprotein translocase subunit SecD
LKQFKWKLLLVVGLFVVACVYVAPSLYSTVPQWWKSLGILPTEKILLGLDLQGGMHLVLEVQTRKAVESRIERTAEDLREVMKKRKIRYAEVDRVNETQILVKLKEQQSREDFDSMLKEEFGTLRVAPGTTEDQGLQMRLELPEKEVKYVE